LKQTRNTGTIAASVIIVIVACGVFANVLFTPRVLLPSDLLKYVYPWKSGAALDARVSNPALSDAVEYFYPNRKFLNEELLAGRVPLWNPHQGAGIPFAATGQPQVFYPVNVLLTAVFGPEDAFELDAALHVMLAGLAMFLYLRALGCREGAGLVGAVSYMLCGWLVVWTMFPPFLAAAAWAPLVLMFYELAVTRGAMRYAAAAGGVLGIDLLCGCPQVTAYILLAAGFVAAGHVLFPGGRRGLLKRAGVPVAAFAVMLVFGLLVGAVQVLPMLELLGESARPESVTGFAGAGIRKIQLMTFFMPDFFGNPSDGRYLFRPAEYVNGTAYFGIGAMLPALVAFALRRDRASGVWTLIAVFGAVAALGPVLLEPLFALPGMNVLKVSRMLYLAALGGPVLAALAWDAVLKQDTKKSGMLLWIALGVAAVACGGAVALLWAGGVDALSLDPAKLKAFEQPNILRLAIFAACVPAAFLLKGRLRGAATALLVVSIVADLATWGCGFNPAGDVDTLYPETRSIGVLRAMQSGERAPCRYQGLHDILFPNSATALGLYDTRVYDPLVPARYAELARAVEERRSGRPMPYSGVVMTHEYAGPLLDLMNVCAVCSIVPLDAGGLDLEHSGEIHIYRNRRSLDRAVFYDRWSVAPGKEKVLQAVAALEFKPVVELFLEEEPGAAQALDGAGGTAEVTDYEPCRVAIEVDARSPGVVFLSDSFASGWLAEVDGERARVLAADYAFRAVPVPAGKHRVALEYRPATVSAGLWMSLSGVLCMVVLLFSAILKQRRK